SFVALEEALARLEAQLQSMNLETQPAEFETAAAEMQATIEEEAQLQEEKASTVSAEAVEEEGAPSKPEGTEAGSASSVASGPMVTDRAFDEELLDIYLTETEEVLAHIAQQIQTLRVNATDKEALVEVRRGFHTLKGSGRTVGL